MIRRKMWAFPAVCALMALGFYYAESLPPRSVVALPSLPALDDWQINLKSARDRIVIIETSEGPIILSPGHKIRLESKDGKWTEIGGGHR